MKKVMIFITIILLSIITNLKAQDNGVAGAFYGLAPGKIPGEVMHKNMRRELNGKDSGNSLNTTLMGRWANGPCFTVDVEGNIAYLGNGAYLEVVDVSNPSEPVELGNVLLPSIIKGIAVKNNYVYVADDWDGLRIIDVSDLANLTEVGNYNTGGYVRNVFISGEYAFLADGYNGLYIVNISDPTSPLLVGTDLGWAALPECIYVEGDYAYIADGLGLEILDVSNPTNPIKIGYCEGGEFGYGYGVTVKNNYAYLAAGNGGLRIIDVSDVTNPTEVGFYDTGDIAIDTYVYGNYAYVSDFQDGLRIIDISDVTNPTEVGFYDTGGYARGVYVKENYAYVADDADGLYIIRNDLAHLYSLNIGNESGEVGDTLLVPVTISDVTGLNIISYQFKVDYDPTVVKAVGIETDSTIGSPSGWSIMSNTNNEGEITVGAFGSEPLTGEGTLVYIKFALLHGGSSTALSFSDVIFNDGNPAPGINNGGITINCNETTSGLPFFEDFEDSSFCNWTFYKYSTGLHGGVVNPYIENGRLFITTHDQQNTWFTNGLDNWSGYSLEFDAKIEQSLDDAYRGINCYFNMNNISESDYGIKYDAYVLTFKGRDNTWYFSRVYSNGSNSELLASGSTPVNVGTDYHIKILSFPTYFVIYFGEPGSEQLLATVNRSATDLTGGKIAFGGGDDIISIDNIHVFKSNFVNVSIEDYSVTSGDTLLIPLSVDSLDNRNIISYQFNLLYDTSIATPLGVVTDNSLSSSGDWSVLGNMNTPGKIIVGAFGSQPLTGNGALVYFKFVFNSNLVDSTQLTLQNFTFNNGDPIPYIENGRVTVNPIIVHVNIPTVTEAHYQDTLLIPVVVDSLDNLNIISYQYNLQFDSTLVSPLGIVTENSLSAIDGWNVMANLNNPGQIVVGGSGSEPLSGEGNLLFMRFIVKGQRADTAKLHFNSFLFNNGTPTADVRDGTVLIKPEVIHLTLPETTYGSLGDTLVVPVNLLDDITNKNIYSFQYAINFDPTLISPIGVQTENTLTAQSDWSVMANTDSSGRIVVGGYGATPLSGNGVLIKMKFFVKTARGDSTILRFDNCILNNGYPIASTNDGMIKTNLVFVDLSAPQSFTASASDTFNVPILISDITDMGVLAYRIKLTFDPEVVNAIGITIPGTLSDNDDWTVLPNINNPGEMVIGGFGAYELTGAGTLIYAKFIATGSNGDSTQLQLTESMLNNGYPGINVTNGSIVVGNRQSEQNITLTQGWNMISSYIMPDTTAVETMMSSIVDNLVLMKNGSGAVYIPAYGIDNIHNWEYSEGYKLYMELSDTLVVSGLKLNPSETPIELSEGWNMFAYLLDSAKAVDECMSNIEENLVIVKDINGHVYIPAYGINTIGDMKVGSGYKGYLSQSDTLLYETGGKGIGNSVRKTDYSMVTHYPEVEMTTGSNMTLIINLKGYQDNSEICVKEMNTGVVVGSGKIIGGRTVLSVKGDNERTEETDGATEGERLGLYLWDSGKNQEERIKEYRIENLLGNSTPEGNGKLHYWKDGLYLMTVAENIKPAHFELYQNYPNPFNPTTVIKYALPSQAHVNIDVFNVLGRKVKTLVDENQSAGEYSIEFNAAELSSGVYYYRLTTGKFISIKKMILIK